MSVTWLTAHPWLKGATRERLVDILLKEHLTSKTREDLLQYDMDRLREKVSRSFRKVPMGKIQQWEERVTAEHESQKVARALHSKEQIARREQCIESRKADLVAGKRIHVYDEPTPLPCKILGVDDTLTHVTVEFSETRKWNEAGRVMVFRHQPMTFIFDPVTLHWLREGLTSEVVKSFSDEGRKQYFALPYTKQYLVFDAFGR